jgi:hypothetical protein
LMILQLRQIRLTEALTFIFALSYLFEISFYLVRNTIRARDKS